MEKYLQRIEDIFRAIDSIYGAAAASYGFSCEGCTENCCGTKFHHHTLVEELYLAEGLKGLGEGKKAELISRAEEVVSKHAATGGDISVMCPLNENGLCILYEHRPMICRIHGVPYEIHKRDLSVEYGVGCNRFMAGMVRDEMKYFPLDRTMFYVEMARLEQEVRTRLQFAGSYSKTTAEMVLSILKYG